jgi:hypothetical protein
VVETTRPQSPTLVDYRGAIRIEEFEEPLEPVVLEDQAFTVVLHKMRLVWPTEARHGFDPDDDQTVVAFDVRDAEGNVLYRYDVLDDPREVDPSRVRSAGRFTFSYTAHPYRLVGSAGAALMVDWTFLPSAPGACRTHLILGLIDGRLQPFAEPFCEILEPPRNLTARVWRLDREESTDDDVLRFAWRTGWVSVRIPVRVDFSAGKLLPSRRCLRLDDRGRWVERCEFPVHAVRRPAAQETFVRLFPRPETGATPDHVVVRPGSKVEFLSALAPNLFDAQGERKPLPGDEHPWLQVRIDGRLGWVREPEDLRALGLSAAG